MCLAIPGEILTTCDKDSGLRHGIVRFGVVKRDICLAYTPKAKVGDWVIVHVGFAIQILDREAAERTLSELAALEKTV